MTQEELKKILQRSEELARNDFLLTEERYDVFLTCMKLFSYLLKAMEGDKDLLIHGNTDSYKWGYRKAVDNACEWLKKYRQDTYDGTGYIAGIVNDKTIEDFRIAMEGEE